MKKIINISGKKISDKKFFCFIEYTLLGEYMKKILFILFSIILVGCKNKDKDILNNIEKKMNSMETYNIQGELNMYNNDDKYTYSVDVSFKKDNKYKVSLINKINNHEQIILKNEDGVYVLTPSLNKSFKFQSDWPNNNSQIYILERLVNDIKDDSDKKFETIDNMYVYTTKVNYSTNTELVKQKIYFDKENNLKKVEVFDDKDNMVMEFNVTNIKANSNIDDDIFKLDSNLDTKTKNVSNTMKNVVYPMYLPNNTYLTGEEKVKKEDGERVILSFGGDSSFTIVEETITVGKELDMDISNGEPNMIMDTVGSLSPYSINWISNDIEYTVMSNDISGEELYKVAKSISKSSVTK